MNSDKVRVETLRAQVEVELRKCCSDEQTIKALAKFDAMVEKKSHQAKASIVESAGQLMRAAEVFSECEAQEWQEELAADILAPRHDIGATATPTTITPVQTTKPHLCRPKRGYGEMPKSERIELCQHLLDRHLVGTDGKTIHPATWEGIGQMYGFPSSHKGNDCYSLLRKYGHLVGIQMERNTLVPKKAKKTDKHQAREYPEDAWMAILYASLMSHHGKLSKTLRKRFNALIRRLVATDVSTTKPNKGALATQVSKGILILRTRHATTNTRHRILYEKFVNTGMVEFAKKYPDLAKLGSAPELIP